MKEAGLTPTPSMLFCEWAETWLAGVKREHSTATFQSYEYHMEKFVLPRLGSFSMTDLQPLAFRSLLSDLEDSGVPAPTRQKIYNTLHSCFSVAAQLELIPRNPISKVTKPKHKRKEINPFTLEEVKRILEFTKADRLHAMYVVAFHLGLRQGELFAIEWGDLDEEAKTISIQRQVVSNRGKNEVKPPKSEASLRTLDLADETLAALQQRRRIAMTEGLAGCSLIFPGPRGAYLSRSTVAQRYWKGGLRKKGPNKGKKFGILTQLDIGLRGMHHARHTFASLALENGESVVNVSAMLGHADPSITLRIYSHAVEAGQRLTAERVAKLFAG